jgi:hypothetical protein
MDAIPTTADTVWLARHGTWWSLLEAAVTGFLSIVLLFGVFESAQRKPRDDKGRAVSTGKPPRVQTARRDAAPGQRTNHEIPEQSHVEAAPAEIMDETQGVLYLRRPSRLLQRAHCQDVEGSELSGEQVPTGRPNVPPSQKGTITCGDRWQKALSSKSLTRCRRCSTTRPI